MARTPSTIILAKDAIGHGIELAGETNTRSIDRVMRIAYYNMAIAELYTILGFIDSESYLQHEGNIIPVTGEFLKHGTMDIPYDCNKVITIEAYSRSQTNITSYESFKLSLDDYISHKRNQGAYPPYDESIVYTQLSNSIEFILGDNITQEVENLEMGIYYRRQPSILTLDTWETELMDAPENYWSLIINRIASLVTLKKGIANESLTYVKMVYEQLLATVEPTLKANLVKSLDIPAGEKYDIQGYNQ